jgi:hypothetical protein
MANNYKYPKSFIELVNEANDHNSLLFGQYIGTGNPNAKIMILGKECAIDRNEKPRQYENEILENAINWKNNIDNQVSIEIADENELWKTDINSQINPLYPYRGQYFKRDRNNNLGTNPTWYNYQKILINILKNLNIPVSTDKANKVFLHEYCFLSELNSETERYSKYVDSIKRKKSIETRKVLFGETFFQQFPIIIVAAGHYPREHDIDLEKAFGVKWNGIINNNKYNNKLNRNWYNIHRETTGCNPKLLIHTNQLSVVTTELLIQLSKECSNFIQETSICL